MIKIRLRRTGATKQPHYRIVVADARAPRDGRYIDLVGHYDPLTEPTTIEVDTEKAARWVWLGGQCPAGWRLLEGRKARPAAGITRYHRFCANSGCRPSLN